MRNEFVRGIHIKYPPIQFGPRTLGEGRRSPKIVFVLPQGMRFVSIQTALTREFDSVQKLWTVLRHGFYPICKLEWFFTILKGLAIITMGLTLQDEQANSINSVWASYSCDVSGFEERICNSFSWNFSGYQGSCPAASTKPVSMGLKYHHFDIQSAKHHDKLLTVS